jgi:protein-L-isoaspartate O-methyltransferase
VRCEEPAIARAAQVFATQLGERVLEIGPGTGYYALDLAEWVGADGVVEIFEIQQERRTSARPRVTHVRFPTTTTRSTPRC